MAPFTMMRSLLVNPILGQFLHQIAIMQKCYAMGLIEDPSRTTKGFWVY